MDNTHYKLYCLFLHLTDLADGVETRIYREIERKLNFTTELVVPSNGKRWGTAYPNGTISEGMLKILYERRADLGFCSVWIEDTKSSSMKFSTYWDVLCLQFLIPKPRILPTRWYNIFTPLPNSIWIMVLVALTITWVTCSILCFLETRIIRNALNGNLGCSRVHNFVVSKYFYGLSSSTGADIISELLTLTGIFLHAKNPIANHAQVNRHLYMWWSLFALVVTSQYSTSLVSHLTYPNFEPMRKTVEDLVRNGFYWGTPYELLMSCVFNLDVSKISIIMFVFF